MMTNLFLMMNLFFMANLFLMTTLCKLIPCVLMSVVFSLIMNCTRLGLI